MFHRFLLCLCLTWVVAVFVDTKVDKPRPRDPFAVSPLLRTPDPYIQPHHFEER